MTLATNKSLFIGIGIVLGLLLATTLYLFYENRELNEVIQNNQNDVKSADQDSSKSIKASIPENTSEKDENVQDASRREAPSAEQTLWLATKKINSFDGYLEFMKSEDNKGAYEQESISNLLKLGTSGWLYSGRTSNNNRYTEDQMVEVLWRKDPDKNLRRALPRKGDIVQLISKQARRTYPDFLPRTNQNGIWPLGKMAYVIDTRMEGKTAVILKIVYE